MNRTNPLILLPALALVACSTDANCPPGTIVKFGACAEAYENMETGDFEDDPPPEPDPYDETPVWGPCETAVKDEPILPSEQDAVDDIFGFGMDDRFDVEACPLNPAHHVGDPWPAKPYSPYIPEMPWSAIFAGTLEDEQRSRMIGNFAVYLGPVPSNHPRAPIYSPLFWQVGADEPERSRVNVVGPPCSRTHYLKSPSFEHPGVNQNCWDQVDDWGVQPNWPHFPAAYAPNEGLDIAGASSVCLANPSGGYTFQSQAPVAAVHPELRGLTYINGAFFQLFIQDVLGSFIAEEIDPLLELGELLDELSVWADWILNWGYYPNCDPDDANDLIAPSVLCPAWSSSGVCSFGIEVTYMSGATGWGWYTTTPCPVPMTGVLPTMDLSIVHGQDGLPLPSEKTSYTGWCMPAYTMWTPGGLGYPPPGGELLDIVPLPREHTGFERGYLLNQDNLTADKLLAWAAQIDLVETPAGVELRLGPEPGGEKLFAALELEPGDVVAEIGSAGADWPAVSLSGEGASDLLIEAVNDRIAAGALANLLIIRSGEFALPTYLMRGSYREQN